MYPKVKIFSFLVRMHPLLGLDLSQGFRRRKSG
jgi:hypothetical protein